MIWLPMADYELPALAAFLEAQEEWGLNAASLIYEGSNRPRWPASRDGRFWKCTNEKGLIIGVIALRNQSTLIPVLPESESWPQFPLPLPKGKHFSILGPRPWTEVLMGQIPFNPYQLLDYVLMSGPETPGDFRDIPENWEFCLANKDDRDLLFPLQAAYEKEEVVFSPEEFEPWACYHNLKELLKREKIWYLQDETYHPRVKGGTNAQGKKWVQLGGVFTDPPFRQRGLGTLLVQRIVNELLDKKYRSSLFVKKKNLPALKLYTQIGFKSKCDFIIAYYFLPKTGDDPSP